MTTTIRILRETWFSAIHSGLIAWLPKTTNTRDVFVHFGTILQFKLGQHAVSDSQSCNLCWKRFSKHVSMNPCLILVEPGDRCESRLVQVEGLWHLKAIADGGMDFHAAMGMRADKWKSVRTMPISWPTTLSFLLWLVANYQRWTKTGWLFGWVHAHDFQWWITHRLVPKVLVQSSGMRSLLCLDCIKISSNLQCWLQGLAQVHL